MNATPNQISPSQPSRPKEIEPWSNRLVVHRASAALLPVAIRLGISPNSVTIAGFLLGIVAAFAYFHWREPFFATAGFLLMIGWHIMDGLDGALARATGRSTPFGRLLDGIADYSTFVAVNIALVLTMPDWRKALAMAVVSGIAHIFQSMFYEAERETYIRRVRGNFQASARSQAGGMVEMLYNKGEALLGNRTRAFDRVIADTPMDRRSKPVEAWRAKAAPRMMLLSPLSANGRTIAIWVACMAGSPAYYWAWETVALTILALAGGAYLRQSEHVAEGR